MTASDAATLRAIDQRAVWHPFTPHTVYADEHPLMVVAGEGHWLIDADGTRYLDGVSSLWCNLFGHRRPELDRAITDQLGRFAHATFLGNASAPAVTLAQRLVDLAPGDLSRVFYSDSGSTAVEVATKMAYQYWQQNGPASARKRTRFVTLGEAYHGDTVGAVSLGGIDLFHRRYAPLLFETIRIPTPDRYHAPAGVDEDAWVAECLAQSEQTIAEHADEIAAVVMEPGVQGAAGMIVHPTGYARRIQDAAHRAGAFFIADEVAVGFGRAGAMFASEIEGLTPDFLCLAKGLTGGYLPMAATLTTEQIFEGFTGPPAEGRTFFHGHTYTGNALAAAAAHATLDLLPAVLAQLPATLAHFTARAEALRNLPHVGDVRYYGLALGVEMMQDAGSRRPFAPADRTGMRICTAAKRRGVFLRPLGDVVVVMPPLTILPDEIDLLFDALTASIHDCCP